MKRQGRMRSRSLTNARPGENLKLRQSYAKAHEFCEVAQWFPEQFEPDRATETHHLMTGRYDLVSNILRVGLANHSWLEAKKNDGRVICLWIKWQKGELDPDEFYTACRIRLAGWLAKTVARIEWVVPLLEQLRKAFP